MLSMSESLFDHSNERVAKAFLPLAARLRPQHLDDYAGQQHLLAKNAPLRLSIEQGQLHSMVLWGPPGVGKTTLAKLIAEYTTSAFVEISAVLSGVKDIRLAVEQAKLRQQQYQQQTVLFVDEVHRFNKSQQDAFLPHIENGDIIFIGATTENPSFELNSALLSRARVYTLKTLDQPALQQVLHRAITQDDKLIKMSLSFDDDAEQLLIASADGDARRLLNTLEQCLDLLRMSAEPADAKVVITASVLKSILKESLRRFDNKGEVFYDQISAMHKSIRGSNPDAALYWFCRMIDGGCDPLYLARRVVRTASEDIGNADPRALQISLDAWQVQERLGSPEGELAIAQAVCYLASAAKSNAVYKAFNDTMACIKETGSLDVPIHLRNAPTKLMKELEYGKEYRYAHNEPNAYAAGEVYLPEALLGTEFYKPVERGLEIKISDKLKQLKRLDQEADSAAIQPLSIDASK